MNRRSAGTYLLYEARDAANPCATLQKPGWRCGRRRPQRWRIAVALLPARDEAAFAVILERHARLVWGVCRLLLPNDPDAEDAFQATFIALFQSAGKIRRTQSLAPWLHGVATRIAKKIRLTAARRCHRERRVAKLESASVVLSDEKWDALNLAIHDEIARLPRILREAFVLCVLEGHRHEEAAAKVGVPVGTLSARVSRGRQKLLNRLMARGLTSAMAATAIVVDAATTPAAAPNRSWFLFARRSRKDSKQLLQGFSASPWRRIEECP